MFPCEEIEASMNITNHLFLLIFQYLLILFDYHNNCQKTEWMDVIKETDQKCDVKIGNAKTQQIQKSTILL